jgi:Arc/MetJ-type ribon-helix-helix transcriptional regulator
MRHIVNISMPAELKREMEKEVKEGKFASTSEFFRHLLRLWQQEKAFRELQEARKEIASGKGNALRSLKDLR